MKAKYVWMAIFVALFVGIIEITPGAWVGNRDPEQCLPCRILNVPSWISFSLGYRLTNQFFFRSRTYDVIFNCIVWGSLFILIFSAGIRKWILLGILLLFIVPPAFSLAIFKREISFDRSHFLIPIGAAEIRPVENEDGFLGVSYKLGSPFPGKSVMESVENSLLSQGFVREMLKKENAKDEFGSKIKDTAMENALDSETQEDIKAFLIKVECSVDMKEIWTKTQIGLKRWVVFRYSFPCAKDIPDPGIPLEVAIYEHKK